MAESDELEGTGFAFIINLARMIDAPEMEVAPGMVLAAATDEQIAKIKRALPNIATPLTVDKGDAWEFGSPISFDAKRARLSRDEYRYFVVRFSGSMLKVGRLQAAFDISPVDLEIGVTIFESGKSANGQQWSPARFNQTLDGYMRRNVFLEAISDDMSLVAECFRLLQERAPHDVNVQRAVRQLGDLKALPRTSALTFLGCFAVLESLLTHEPKPNDPYSSITRQVKTKLALLNSRFDRPIDYSPFSQVAADKVWTKMYDYRSSIAHGAEPDFIRELMLLNNAQVAQHLLAQTTKSVVRQALREPQLLADLRNC